MLSSSISRNFLTSLKNKGLIFSSVRCFAQMSPQFEEAQKRLKSLTTAPDNQIKLKLYGLFKQVTIGKNNTKKPGMMDFVGAAKWVQEAWNKLGDLTPDEAQKKYIELVNSLAGTSGSSTGNTQTGADSESKESDGLKITVENGIRTILLNRPKKKNALNQELYTGIIESLKEANTDPNTNIVVITGAGDYFTSGNDLANFMNVTDPVKAAKDAKELLLKYVGSFIDLEKPLIALVNGPTVGIGMTVLGLCDTVYCSDKATFVAPLVALGQSTEGCASYTFPKIMGYAKASEILYFGQKITAEEAKERGLVAEIFPDGRFNTEAWKRVKSYTELPFKSLKYTKDLVRGPEREILHKVNKAECERLEERWTSEDCMNAIMNFFQKKAKV